MTLNTFHFAGEHLQQFTEIKFNLLIGHGAANVTLGIPRLREIVMTASQKPKTPSMTMKVRPGISPQEMDLFCKRASRVKLSQVVDNVTVTERIVVTGHARRTEFTVDIRFFPKEEYESEYDVEPHEILAAFATRFPLMLKKEMQSEMKKLDADLRSQIAELGKGRKVSSRRNGEEQGKDDDDDDDGEATLKKRDADEGSEVGDGDADDNKRARQKKEQATYESDESGDEDAEEFGDAALEAEFATEPDEGTGLVKDTKDPFQTQVHKVKDTFQRNLNHATSFSFTEACCEFKLEVS